MNKLEVGRAVVLGVITLIALMAVGVWSVWDSGRLDWLKGDWKDLAACGGDMIVFNNAPVSVDKLAAIIPLGSTEPEDGVVFPRDRLLLIAKDMADSGSRAAHIRVSAPGSGWITKVAEIEYWSDSKMVDKDFTVYFSPCEEVEAAFYHLRGLETRINEEINGKFGEQYSARAEGVTQVVREAAVKIGVNSGEALGWAGGGDWRQILDWGVTDKRNEPLVLARRLPEDEKLEHAVCPLDYYPAGKKEELTALLGDGKKKREEAPVCGRADQDIVGTVQGRWRAEKSEPGTAADKHVALLHDVIEPQRPVFSMGTSLTKSGMSAGLYYFRPKTAGFINRDFAAATERGQVYCYQGLQDSLGQAAKKVLLVELVDDKTLKMEARSGLSCATSGYIFSDLMTVFER